MAYRYQFYFVILSIIGSLLIYGPVRAQERPLSDNSAEQQMVTGPEQHPMRLVSFDPWVVEGEVMTMLPPKGPLTTGRFTIKTANSSQ